jgi:hypothetical protein
LQALNRIYLDKIIPMPANVADVNIEDLLARPEVSNDVIDLRPGIGKLAALEHG